MSWRMTMGVQAAADVAARKQREGKTIVSYDCTVNGEEVVVELRDSPTSGTFSSHRHVLSRSVALSMASELMRCVALMDVKADRRRHETFMDVVSAHTVASKPDPHKPAPVTPLPDPGFAARDTLQDHWNYAMLKRINELVAAVNAIREGR